jgi:YD repeat-containing protein
MVLMHKAFCTRSLVLQSVALGCLLFAQPAAAQDGFVDGSFDVQGSTLSGYCYFVASTCPSGVWSGYSGIIKTPNSDWQITAAPSPNTVAFVQNNGNIAQTFTAIASKRVRITWVEADRPGLGGETYIVKVNGVAVGTYTSSTSSFVRRYSDYFDIVSGSAYTINFQGTLSSGDHSAFIDSVRLASADSQTTYTYDALGRLTGVTIAGGSTDGVQSTYAYDSAGNRTVVTVSGAP